VLNPAGGDGNSRGAKHAVWRDYQKARDPGQQWGVRTGLTWAGLTPDVLFPVGFAAAWLFVIFL
jgi:hypothetical protein